jgi:uncharacterized Zn-finger protein
MKNVCLNVNVIVFVNSPGSSAFKCDYPNCGKAFSRHDNLRQHLRVHKDYSAPKDGRSATNERSGASPTSVSDSQYDS